MSLDWLGDQPLIVDKAAVAGEQRRLVVTAARTWVGTPYHHAADVKGHGVDCAMLLVRIYCDLGLVERFYPRPYTRDWFLHRNEERYLDFLLGRAKEVRDPDLGGVIAFKIGRCFAHAGIISRLEPLSIIHAFMNAGRVIEDIVPASAELSSRPKKFASFWG